MLVIFLEIRRLQIVVIRILYLRIAPLQKHGQLSIALILEKRSHFGLVGGRIHIMETRLSYGMNLEFMIARVLGLILIAGSL